jgi:hypothetical protein
MQKKRISEKKVDRKISPSMDHKNPRAMARHHPLPHRSPLWKHLELIRSMRLGRHTWEQIADRISEIQGESVHPTTVYNFFKRYADRLKRTGRGQALGFEPLPGDATPAAPGPAQPAAAPAPPSTIAEEQPDYIPVEEPDDGITEFQRKRRQRLLAETQQKEQQQKDNPPQ